MNKSILIVFVILCASGKFESQNANADSIISVYQKQKTQPASFINDTTMVRTLGELVWELRVAGNYKYALLYADTAFKVLERHQGDEVNAERKKAVEKKYLFILNCAALVYSNSGNYPEAMKIYYSMLKKAAAINDSSVLSVAYNNLGNVYWAMKNDSEAVSCFSRAMLIMKAMGDKKYGKIYSNIGIVYMQKKNYPKAEECFNKALEFCLSTGYKPWISGIYTNLGDFYYKTGNYDKALQNFFLSLKIKKEAGAKALMPVVYNNIASIYLEQKKYKNAFVNFELALSIAKEVGEKERIVNAYRGLAQAYSETNNFKAAFANYKLYIAYRDSLSNDEFTKKTIKSKMQYDFDKRSATDSIKNSEAKKLGEVKHKQEISKQKTFTYGGIAGFLVMIVVAGISFRAFKNKQKANTFIAHQKALVEEKQKEILDSIHYAKRIQTALMANEKYVERNLNRLKRK